MLEHVDVVKLLLLFNWLQHVFAFRLFVLVLDDEFSKVFTILPAGTIAKPFGKKLLLIGAKFFMR